jgi:hypothetical protein
MSGPLRKRADRAEAHLNLGSSTSRRAISPWPKRSTGLIALTPALGGHGRTSPTSSRPGAEEEAEDPMRASRRPRAIGRPPRARLPWFAPGGCRPARALRKAAELPATRPLRLRLRRGADSVGQTRRPSRCSPRPTGATRPTARSRGAGVVLGEDWRLAWAISTRRSSSPCPDSADAWRFESWRASAPRWPSPRRAEVPFPRFPLRTVRARQGGHE